MKVRVLHIILLLLVASEIGFAARGFDYKIVESTDQYMIVDVRFDSISFIQRMENGLWMTDILLPHAGVLAQPGRPQLPFVSLMLGIPADSRPALTILNENNQTKNIGRVPLFQHADAEPSLNMNPLSNAWLPATFAQLGVDGFIRDQRVLQVQLFPVRYQAASQTAQIARSLRLRIDFGAAAASSTVPVRADERFEPVYKDLLANYETSMKWRRTHTPRSSLRKTAGADQQRVKLYLSQDGVYAVSGRDLAEAGVDITQIYPRTLAMTNKGQPVPIIIEGKSDGAFDLDDRIIFLGSHNSGDNSWLSFYSDANVYMLSWGGAPGLAFSEMLASPNGDEVDTLDSAVNYVHFEQDNRYERLVGYDNGKDDHWFWDKIMDNQSFSKTVTLPGLYAESTLKLDAKFHGLTQSADVDLNHHVVARINDQMVGEGYGSDKKQFSLHTGRFKLDVFQPQLKVVFELPLDIPDVLIDHVFLNWFAFEYDRSLRTTDDRLVFRVEPGAQKLWRVGGFSTDQVYFLTDNGYRLVNANIKSRADGYDFEFTYNSSQETMLHIVSEKALRRVEQIKIDVPSDLKNPMNGADYIIITHKKFDKAAQRLADYRRGKGLRSIVVDIQDVYDEFSDGVYDPRAIKRFIAYAYENWQRPALLYVVLFGDATLLMDKTAARKATFRTFVPSYMVNTKSYGMTSSDNYFVTISGDDDLPDLYLGRLPANTIEEADIMVEKIIGYETRDVAAEWRRNITLASGNGEFFDYAAQYLVDHYLPKWLATKRLSTEFQSPYFNTTEDFIAWVNGGQNIINFLVHGSGEQIADANLFNKDDIIRLANKNKYSFAVTMSCYIGHFDSPEVDALGEALLVAQDRGIMGLFGSTGKSYLYSDFYFNGAVFEGIFQKNWRTLGEITTNSKYVLIEKTLGYWEPVENFLLLGDPATELNMPHEDIKLTLSKKVLADGDVLTVSGQLPLSQPGNLTLAVLSEEDSVLVEKQIELLNDRFSTPLFTLTPAMRRKWGDQGGLGQVQAHFTDGQYAAVGAASFSVVQPLISGFTLSPEKPSGFEPFYFVVEISTDVAAQVGGIQSLIVKWSLDNRSWSDLPMSRQGDDAWRTDEPLSLEEGTTIWYKLVISAGNGSVSEMETQQFKVLYKPDVYWSADVRYSDAPAFVLTVKNRGESDAKQVALRVRNKTTGQTMVDGFVLPLIKARRDTMLSLPTSALAAGSYELELTLDPNNAIIEEEEENNVLLKMLHVATPEGGSNGTFLYALHNVSATIPAGGVSKTTSVELTTFTDDDLIDVAARASLALLPLKGAALPKLYRFFCSDSSMTLQASPQVAMTIDPTDSLAAFYLASGGVRIYAWDDRAGIWKGQETTRAGDVLTASLPAQSMIFALMGSADDQPPQVSISVSGQNFADGDAVPARPAFTIAVEDAGGVDVSSDHLILSVDGVPLSPSDYVMAFDPKKAGDVKLTYNSELTAGEHVLDIQVRDVNGNTASQQIQFRIAEEFGLDFIANHPNPFADETTFAFQISDMASKVTLNIYTVSGRLIRTFEFADVAGYNEVDWDGADKDGNEIANGVYYLKFVARKGDERIERIERLAKLK